MNIIEGIWAALGPKSPMGPALAGMTLVAALIGYGSIIRGLLSIFAR